MRLCEFILHKMIKLILFYLYCFNTQSLRSSDCKLIFPMRGLFYMKMHEDFIFTLQNVFIYMILYTLFKTNVDCTFFIGRYF